MDGWRCRIASKETGRSSMSMMMLKARIAISLRCVPKRIQTRAMAHLWQRIEERYERAQNLGAAFKTPTKIELERDPISGADFVIRISEALKQKPKSSSK